ncbi:MAG TPA: hypothetical protein VM328_03460 [Fimbriimonadaceae bacterium]|nr:hypothetical protein [Fimbriimonadaceae bacterium]
MGRNTAPDESELVAQHLIEVGCRAEIHPTRPTWLVVDCSSVELDHLGQVVALERHK